MIWLRDPVDTGEGTYVQARRRVILTLDSNLFREIVAVLVDGKGTKTDLFGILDLARKALVWRAEQQAIGYLREIILHAPLIETKAFANKAVEGILRMYALNPNLSEFGGKPVYNETSVVRIQERVGEASLESCARKLVDDMYENSAPVVGGTILLFYATYLKMISVGLSHKDDSLDSKCATIDDFVVNQLGAVQPRLFALSRLFFKRQLDGVLKAQPGNDDFDRSKLIGSTYDIYLSTIHEEILGDSDPSEATLSILCTRDVGLADYAGRFPLEAIARMRDNSLRILHSWDDTWIKGLLGDQVFDAMNKAIEEKSLQPRTRRPPDNIGEMLAALEDELRVPDEKRLLRGGRQVHVPDM